MKVVLIEGPLAAHVKQAAQQAIGKKALESYNNKQNLSTIQASNKELLG